MDICGLLNTHLSRRRQKALEMNQNLEGRLSGRLRGDDPAFQTEDLSVLHRRQLPLLSLVIASSRLSLITGYEPKRLLANKTKDPS